MGYWTGRRGDKEGPGAGKRVGGEGMVSVTRTKEGVDEGEGQGMVGTLYLERSGDLKQIFGGLFRQERPHAVKLHQRILQRVRMKEQPTVSHNARIDQPIMFRSAAHTLYIIEAEDSSAS